MRKWTNLCVSFDSGWRAAISGFGQAITFETKLLTSVIQVIYVAIKFLEQEGSCNPGLTLKDRKGARGR